MESKLDHRVRYLQIAFNYDAGLVQRVLPTIPRHDRILVEAGTPYIKREGMRGVALMRSLWSGHVVADMKVTDGAELEVRMAAQAGADAVTVYGNSPPETLNLFIDACRRNNVISMVDLLAVEDPLAVMRPLHNPPDVAVIHRGRDEEGTQGKTIQYRQVNRIRSKYDVSISAAGGVDLKEARSAIFNGANIVVVNLVRPGDPWQGISTQDDIASIARTFLETIE